MIEVWKIGAERYGKIAERMGSVLFCTVVPFDDMMIPAAVTWHKGDSFDGMMCCGLSYLILFEEERACTKTDCPMRGRCGYVDKDMTFLTKKDG